MSTTISRAKYINLKSKKIKIKKDFLERHLIRNQSAWMKSHVQLNKY